MTKPVSNQTGKVYLVGAGPGDPGLLTLRGMECLREPTWCSTTIWSIPPSWPTRESAELVCLGHHRQCRTMAQGEVNRRMIEAAAEGRIVVRLKGGDPDVFAHSAEETEACARRGSLTRRCPA